jgi:hypothetical protein
MLPSFDNAKERPGWSLASEMGTPGRSFHAVYRRNFSKG